VTTIRADAQNGPRSILEALDRFSGEYPGRTVFRYLPNGEGDGITLSYAGLRHDARRVASALRSRGFQGQRALLPFGPGLEFIVCFFGCLQAGVIPVPVHPPKLTRNPVIAAIAADSGATLVLTTRRVHAALDRLKAAAPALASLTSLALEDFPQHAVDEAPEPKIGADDLCYLQYTSGSTSVPKGVMISHGNVAANCRMIASAMALSSQSSFVNWLPHYHDMGLVGTILEPVWLGAQSTLLPAAAVMQRPSRWLKAISRFKASISGSPNSGYRLCVDEVDTDDCADVDLSCWELACVGAEPISKDVLTRFAEKFGRLGFRARALYPCYGLAEATLMVTGGALAPFAPDRDRTQIRPQHAGVCHRDLVACGRPVEDQEVWIVERDTGRRCADGQPGEIWVRGPSVAKGYWNRPEQTQEVFGAFPADPVVTPFLRTGDTGFLRDGELFVTGRIKDLVIVRGVNHHPEDIEDTVRRSHPKLAHGVGAAFAVVVEGAERLVVVHEIKPADCASLDRIISEVRAAITVEHELSPYAIVLIRANSIPRGTSGKVQRFACRDAYLGSALHVIRAWQEEAPATAAPDSAAKDGLGASRDLKHLLRMNATERYDWTLSLLVSAIAQAARRAPATIDPDRPVSAFGVDSVAILKIAHTIQSKTGLRPDLGRFLESASLRQLAAVFADEAVIAALATDGGGEAATLQYVQELSDEDVARMLEELKAREEPRVSG
jgi:acyl-CoA synthetase (AMP-forming)/AMP-acid ligase II